MYRERKPRETRWLTLRKTERERERSEREIFPIDRGKVRLFPLGNLVSTGSSLVDPPSDPTPTTVTADLSNSLSKTEVHYVSSVPPAPAASVPPASVSTRYRWRRLSLDLLSDHDEVYVHNALHVLDPRQTALRIPSHVDLRFSDFHCLKPLVWLSDEVINLVLLLLQDLSKDTMVLSTFTKEVFSRAKRKGVVDLEIRTKMGRQLAKHLKKHQVHSTTGLCHTFLINIILFQLNAQELRRVLVPLHVGGSHWTLLVVNLDQDASQPTCIFARSEIRTLTL